MSIFINEILKKLTLRAGTALLLSMAESVLPELESDQESFSLCREALDLAWEWQNTGNVRGDDLTQYVNNPDDERGDLAIYQLHYEDGTVMQSAVIVVCYSVSYAARSAYRMEKEISIPDFIDVLELDNIIQQILNFAEKTNIFDKKRFINAYNFLLKEYSTDNQNELGEPVEKEVLMAFYQ